MHIHDQLIRNQSCLSEIYVSLGLNFQNTTIILKHNFFSTCFDFFMHFGFGQPVTNLTKKNTFSCDCKTGKIEKLRGS